MKRSDIIFAGLLIAFVAVLLVVDWSKSPAKGAIPPAAPAVTVGQVIGIWKMTVEVPEGLKPPPKTGETSADSDEALRNALRELKSNDEISVRITYRADGTGVIESSAAGWDRRKPFSWGLLSVTTEQIRIEQETSNPPLLERITYKIDSPDQMTITNGAMKGSILLRVK